MINILCIGDPHFKSDNGEETQEMTEKIGNLINTRKPDIVVILGDILHRHEKVDLPPFCRANKFLETIHRELMVYDGFLYIVIGNHDRSNNTIFMTDEHVFNPLKKWKNTFVADKAIIHKAKLNCVIVPYVPPGRLAEAIATIDPEFVTLNEYSEKFRNEVNIVFAHQEFMGAKMNTITSNVGDPWPKNNPLCVSGHIHDYQMLEKNLIYTGTPIQHGFADSTRKTVSWITLDDKRFSEERINLGIKGKRQFNILAEDFENHYKHFISEASDCYVKLKITASKTLRKNLEKTPQFKKVVCHANIKIQWLETSEVDSKIKFSCEKTKVQVPFRQRLDEALLEMKDVQEIFREFFK